MEKKAIIDEMFTYARVCLDEDINMTVQTVRDPEEIPVNCSKCNEELIVLYWRPSEAQKGDNDYDLTVLKCKECNRVIAVYIEPFSDDGGLFNADNETATIGKRIIEPPSWKYVGDPLWSEGERPLFSRRCADAYRKAISHLEHQQSRLDRLIRSKYLQMCQAGLDTQEINSARTKITRCFKSSFLTSKQLTSACAAAIYIASQEHAHKTKRFLAGKKQISERDLEKIFGVTRKTIRKWKGLLVKADSLPARREEDTKETEALPDE